MFKKDDIKITIIGTLIFKMLFSKIELSSVNHTEMLSSAQFLSDRQIIVASRDGSVLLGDIEKSESFQDSYSLSSSIFSMIAQDETKILVGCIDNSVKMLDLRVKSSNCAKCTFNGHTNVVSCLKWDPLCANKNNFFSGSYDKTIRLWDMRSHTVPLYNIKDHRGRVLTISADDSIFASGAAEGNLNVYDRSETFLF